MQKTNDGTLRTWSHSDAHFMEDILINVSHELRTPLAVAKGYATSLLRYDDRLPHDERVAMVGEIDVACDRLENVITQMLQTARLMQGTVTLHRHPHDLAHLTRAAITQVEQATAEAATNDHPIIFQHDPSKPVLVLVDERLFTPTLAHLLENARNYSLKGLPITVTLQTTGKAAKWSVQDQGIGIAADQLPHIFDPFYRVATDLTQEISGLGLGLTFGQRVMALHGGTLQVASKVGQGSRFWFALPLEAAT